MLARRHLPQSAAVAADLEHLPAAMRADGREQQVVRVEVQIDVADEHRLRRPVQRC